MLWQDDRPLPQILHMWGRLGLVPCLVFRIFGGLVRRAELSRKSFPVDTSQFQVMAHDTAYCSSSRPRLGGQTQIWLWSVHSEEPWGQLHPIAVSLSSRLLLQRPSRAHTFKLSRSCKAKWTMPMFPNALMFTNLWQLDTAWYSLSQRVRLRHAAENCFDLGHPIGRSLGRTYRHGYSWRQKLKPMTVLRPMGSHFSESMLSMLFSTASLSQSHFASTHISVDISGDISSKILQALWLQPP